MKTMNEYISTAEGVNQMWEKINQVLDGFDFSKVKVVMEALDWMWVCTKDEAKEYREMGLKVNEDGFSYFQPEVPQLNKFARELILLTINEYPDGQTMWGSATGGFDVKVYLMESDEQRRKYYGDDNVPDDFKHNVDISLSFVAEDSQTF